MPSTALHALVFTTVLLPCQNPPATEAPGHRPNVILILADDLGYGDLGIHGSEDVQTPHIDSLAQQGMLFERFYANASVCSPTRAALMTGCYPWRIGVMRNIALDQTELPSSDLVFLPKLMAQADYRTALIGKWHLGVEGNRGPNARGFDLFYDFLGAHAPYTGRRRSVLKLNDEPADRDGHLTDLLTDKAIEFIRGNSERPFFLYLPYSVPHGPIEEDSVRHIRDHYTRYQKKGREKQRALFCALVDHLDWNIGRILQTLADLEIDSNTLVIFTNDNGPSRRYLGNQGGLIGQKATVHEGGIRVACMFRWPGTIPANTRSKQLASTIDLYATLIDAAGLPRDAIPEQQRAACTSLLPHATSGGESDLDDRTLMFRHKNFLAVRRGPWKLTVEFNMHVISDQRRIDAALWDDAIHRLLDLDADPRERTNLYQEHPELAAELRSHLWNEFADPTLPLPVPTPR